MRRREYATAGSHLVGDTAANVALCWTALTAVADRELSPAASTSQIAATRICRAAGTGADGRQHGR